MFRVSYNQFGDTVLYLFDEDKSWNMFQYNCSGAKSLLKIIQDFAAHGYTSFVNEDGNIQSAIKYIQELITLNDEVNSLQEFMPLNNSVGAEIAGHYGY